MLSNKLLNCQYNLPYGGGGVVGWVGGWVGGWEIMDGYKSGLRDKSKWRPLSQNTNFDILMCHLFKVQYFLVGTKNVLWDKKENPPWKFRITSIIVNNFFYNGRLNQINFSYIKILLSFNFFLFQGTGLSQTCGYCFSHV